MPQHKIRSLQLKQDQHFLDSSIKKIALPFGKIYFFEKFLVAHLNRGIVFTQQESDIIIAECLDFYKDRKFGYITYRVNKYSVHPTIYFVSSNIPTLVGIAVVSDLKISTANVKLEQQFFTGAFKHFNLLPKAVAFILKLHES